MAANLLVLTKVIVCTVGYSLKFCPTPGESVFDVIACLGVMREFVAAVFPES